MANYKVSHDDDHFDFNKLEREVQQSVVNDERYWTENAAKIRAVEQRVPTYEDFKDIVAASHLKPLEKGDKIATIGKFTQVWNQHADAKKISPDLPKTQIGDQKENIFVMPSSGQDFAQRWKRIGKSAAEQRHFLFNVGPEKSSALFKTEITGGLLGEFLECLQNFEEEKTESVTELLEAFTLSQRFSLCLAFLSKKEKDLCKVLFENLSQSQAVKESTQLAERLNDMQKMYNAS